MAGIFSQPKSVVRLIGALLLEQDEEWSIAGAPLRERRVDEAVSAPASPPTAQEILASIAQTPTARRTLNQFPPLDGDTTRKIRQNAFTTRHYPHSIQPRLASNVGAPSTSPRIEKAGQPQWRLGRSGSNLESMKLERR